MGKDEILKNSNFEALLSNSLREELTDSQYLNSENRIQVQILKNIQQSISKNQNFRFNFKALGFLASMAVSILILVGIFLVVNRNNSNSDLRQVDNLIAMIDSSFSDLDSVNFGYEDLKLEY
jgi:hypothetical protein